MKLLNVTVQAVLVVVLATLAGAAAAQQDFPNRAIRIITPYPPGGGTSPLARLYSQKLTDSWGQPVIVDNRGGGNTVIGTDAVAKSPPDGYTVLLTLNTHVVLPLLLPTPYDGIRDFAPVASVSSGEQLMVVPVSVPANTLQEFIALAKSRPGQLNYASAGGGTINHLSGESFKLLAGVNIQHIPYKGGGPAITDLIAGRVQMYSAVPISLLPHIQSGKIKPIAISGDKRMPSMPEVPTFTEAGLPGFDARASYWILAPAGTPRAVVDKLSAEFARITGMPDTQKNLASLGMEPFVSNADQLAALMRVDVGRYAKIIKAANITIEN